ncbi:MAG TPA: tetratricopeptide repeat protein [Candidatus Limnocylindrales bacterium]|nr:tetratricopeptide repeat protein [Candidatus Limnocylindrales bacterium]
MLRRTLTFLAAVALIAAVATLVWFNSQPTTFKLAPDREYTLPLAWLLVGAVTAGLLLGLIALIAREGHWALRQWRVERARRSAERAIARKTEARSLVLAGQYGKARALLTKAVKSPGADVGDVVDLADSYVAEGDWTHARQVLEEGLKDFGSDPLLLHALARCCRALGDDAAAASALDRAVDAFPASITLNRMLRDTLVDLQRWKRAEKVQQRLVELLPDDPRERASLVEIRMEAAGVDEPAQREASLRSVLALDPAFAPAAAESARILDTQGRHRAAVRLLYKAAKRRPDTRTLAALDELLAEKELPRLLKIYGKLRARHPGNGELQLHYAQLMMSLGREDDGERALDQLDGSGGPYAVAAERLRAELYRKREDLEHANEALQRALECSLRTGSKS